MNGITSFEGIQLNSVRDARRCAAAAGGYAVTIGRNCYVVPKKEVARIRAAGVEIRVVYSPGDSNRRPVISEKWLSAGTTIGR